MTEYSMHREMGYGVTCTAGQTFYLSALSHCGTQTALVLAQWLSSAIICTHVCLPQILTEVITDYYSRVVFILLRVFHCDYLTASTIQLQHLMQETFIMATKKEYLALICVGFIVFLICHLDHALVLQVATFTHLCNHVLLSITPLSYTWKLEMKF